MSPYQHPFASALPPSSQSPNILAIDHLLSLQLNTRFAQLRAQFGLPTGASLHSERKQEGSFSDVLGYGRKGRKLMAARGMGKSSFRSVEIGEEGLKQVQGLEVKAEGIEKVLSTMLAKYRSASSSANTSVYGGDYSDDADDSDDDSFIADTSSPVDHTLPEGIQIRLALSELLHILLQNEERNLQPIYTTQSTHAVTHSQEKAIELLYNVSSPLSSSSINAIPSAADFRPDFSTPSLNATRPSVSFAFSSSSRNHTYPPGSIWDQVPRAAGPEGPWAFAGSQSTTATSSVRTNAPNRASSELGLPSIPTPVGPKSKKAVGRSKALYLDGVSREPSWGSMPSSRLSTSSSLNPSGSTTDRPVSSGLSPALENWFRLDESADRPSELLGGKLLNLLRQFFLVSAALSKSIGQATVDEKAKLMRRRMGRVASLEEDWLDSDSEGSVAANDTSSSSGGSDDERDGGQSSQLESTSSSHGHPQPHTHRQPSAPFHPTKASSFQLPPSIPPSRRASRESSPAPPRASRTSVARPTREWYALLAGLLTQVCLEGFLHHGWLGGEGVELVLGVGSGGVTGRGAGLAEAGWVLFGGKKNEGKGSKRREEFEKEMEERRSEFLTIDNQTASLLDHLHSLSMQYPLEPVEQAFLKFIEDASHHLGVPDLANLQPIRSSPFPSVKNTSTAPNAMSLASLLNDPPSPHPSSLRFPTYQAQPPTPPLHPSRPPARAGVQRYFVAPKLRVEGLTSLVGQKRRDRSCVGSRADGGFKVGKGKDREGNVVSFVEDYPDPYGV